MPQRSSAPTLFIENTLLLLLSLSLTPKNPLGVSEWVHSRAFGSVPLVWVSVVPSVPHCSCVVSLNSRVIPPTLLFILKMGFRDLGSFAFPCKF